MALNERQKRFVEEYLVDLCATGAAIRAGYSKRSAGSVGQRLLKNPEIAAEIKRLSKERTAKIGLTADRVLKEIARIALFDPRTMFNKDGTLKSIIDLDDDAAAAIAGMDISEITTNEGSVTVTKKIKLARKEAALDMAIKHLGISQPRGLTQLERRIKKLEIEKRELELELMRKESEGGGDNDADWLNNLVEHLPD